MKNVIKAAITRTYSPTETKGSFYVFDGEQLAYRCKCIELPWNNNQHNVSCIPEGIYSTKKIVRPNGNQAFLVSGVPDRDLIEIHVGNFASGGKKDTKGCVLPGIYFTDINDDGFVDIASSNIAMDKLLIMLPDEFQLYVL